jgi:squalene-hopene/tetraprenyl-beta-curcumene cyclase
MTTFDVAPAPVAPGLSPESVAATIGAARARLLALQSEDGWWQGKLQSNVTIEAEDLLLREFLGIRGTE